MNNSNEIKHTALYKSIYALFEKAIEKIIIYQKQNKLIKIPQQYIPVKEIDYLAEGFTYDWDNIQYFDFYKWGIEEFSRFLQEELSVLPEFEDAASAIVQEFQLPEFNVKAAVLQPFLILLLKEVPNKKISFDNIDSYIKILIDDCKRKDEEPVTWHVQLWLNNIYIESDEIEIAQNAFLRKPSKEQLTYIGRREDFDELSRYSGRRLPATAILSFSLNASIVRRVRWYPEEIDNEIENWLNVFRLFRLSDVVVIHQNVIPVSILEYPISEAMEKTNEKFWHSRVEAQDISNYKFYLRQHEEEQMRDFITKLKPILKDISLKTYLNGNYYDLALHRYNDAIIKSEVNIYRILSAMSSFEALLTGDEKGEITYKIRIRVAKLLGYFDLDSIQVFNKMKGAYNLRSRLVHGDKIKPKEIEFARNYTHEILDYNRICLLISLQLKNKTTKSLIDHIDHACINDNADKELKDIIDKNVKIPILKSFGDIK